MKYLSLLVILISSSWVQASETISLAILSTDFVMPVKYQRLQQLASSTDIDVTHVEVGNSSQNLSRIVNAADLVILDGPRPSDQSAIKSAITRLESSTEQQLLPIPWLQIGGGRPDFSGLPVSIARQLTSYYGQGGAANFKLFLTAVDRWHNGESLADLPAASELPETGVYTPNKIYSGLQQWFSDDPDKADQPLLGFAISDSSLRNLQTGLLEQLYQQTIAAGLTPVLFWFNQSEDYALTQFWQNYKPAALVNLTHMQNGEARKREFQQLDVPVFHGSTYRNGSREDWLADDQGRGAGAFATLQVIPESWGVADPLLIAAMGDGEPVLINDQFRLLTDKVKSLVRLKNRANSDKQVAIMYWNTPAGEENLSASNLNVPRSLVQITQALQSAGYQVAPPTEEQTISTAKRLLSGLYHPDTLPQLEAEQLTLKLSLAEYQKWFEQLPRRVQQDLISQWGKPADHQLLLEVAAEPSFLIPAARWQNVWLLPQPPRAGKVGAKTHDTKLAPDHYYLAAYLALQQQNLDALIHLGTHGTQEWTPGKARDLSADDYPMLTLGSMPVFYPYIQDNVSEALQARRRGRAITISHQTPAFAPSGLYEELLDIHSLVHNYEQVTEGQVKATLSQQLIKQAEQMDLLAELGYSKQQATADFDTFYHELHEHLHRIAASVTPLGLHTFGQPAPQDERLLTILQQLGKPYIAAVGEAPDELLTSTTEKLQQSRSVAILRQALHNPNDPVPAELESWLTKARENNQHLAQPHEVESLLHALNGGFIRGGLGGDPVREPQTSSGANLYAFDPRKIPAQSAYQAADEALQKLIENYRSEHGEYPDKLAFSLWSSETQRHLGLVEAQVLRALGLKPVWGSGDRLTALTIIPKEQLERPRIDAVLQITSVYRDQFDGFMRLLADAIARLANLDDDNTIARNSERLANKLESQGIAPAKARQYAQLRLFSNAPGDYGSGVPDVTLDSTNWEDESAIAEQFLSRLQYAYGSGEWGIKIEQSNLLAEQLSDVDAAVMSRSSNLHGLLSTDHPFEYLGGIAAAVRHLSGRDIGLYINDLRQKESRVVEADRFISEELRSRYLNPQWIAQMQQEGYSGALNMLDIVNNVFGWQATAPQTIRDDQWQALHDVYVDDKYDMQMNEWFEQQQSAAQLQMIERMTEAIRKDYWDANQKTKESLAQRYQQLRQIHPDYEGNQTTQAFIDKMAATTGTGFGLNAGQGQAAGGQTANGQQMVSGQQLQKQAQQQVDDSFPWQKIILFGFIFLIISAGALQHWRTTQQRMKKD